MLKVNIIIFILLILCLGFCISKKVDGNQEYNFCLRKSYEYYKKDFMSKDGRIIDPNRGNITTSEGQSYIMLRSLTVDDRSTFDLAYRWAKNNLQREDSLFSWLWGKNKQGEYKILDENTASDADVDIAFSLILAYEKWGGVNKGYEYLQDAKDIINSIWEKETRRIGSYLVLSPGVIQNTTDEIEFNPSYFAPYAFRFFQKYDDVHDWNCLIDSSYYYLGAVMSKTETNLPPNWFSIENGQIVLQDSDRSDFSYDAVRVFLRVYLDYLRTGEKQALPVLEKTKFFITKWQDSHKFYTNYKKNGELRDSSEYIGSIAILTPIIGMYNSDVAAEIYKTKLDPSFSSEKFWESRNDYYGKNLSWFGCYFYNKDSNEYKEMHKRRIIGY